jgi:hypothetical protein
MAAVKIEKRVAQIRLKINIFHQPGMESGGRNSIEESIGKYCGYKFFINKTRATPKATWLF